MAEVRYVAREIGSSDRFWEFGSAQHLEDYLRLAENWTLSRHRCPLCRTRMVNLHKSAVPRGIPTLLTCANTVCNGSMYYIPQGGQLTKLPPERYLELRRAGR